MQESEANRISQGEKPSTIEARSQQALRCTPEQLYDAWLDPKKVRVWMSNSLKSIGLAGDLRRVETDPRVGGKFCFSDMRSGAEVIHVGSYLALDRPRKIAFTWMASSSVEETEKEVNPSTVTLSIESSASGCVATIVHEMDSKWAEYVSRTEASWTRMLKAVDAIHQA